MGTVNSPDRKRIITGVLIGVLLLGLTAGAYSMALLMISVLVIGCIHSPPDWFFYLVFTGFPIPLIITSIVVPYLYIKKQKVFMMIFTSLAGLSLSCLIFLIWFLLLTQYC